MYKTSIIIGKTVKKAMKLRGGGSALPGLIVEKMSPRFLEKALHQLPLGIILVSGTNGKTTTTKIISQLLKSAGLKVFTNPSGSNFTRGIVASLLSEININGSIDADIAVLELDEAYATHFVKNIKPRFSLILNILRDQLDRFGEIDNTAKLLEAVVKNTTEGIILNGDDDLVAKLAKGGEPKQVTYFGVSQKLNKLFPSDSGLLNERNAFRKKELSVSLEDIENQKPVIKIGEKTYQNIDIKLKGLHNLQNIVAALATVKMVLAEKFDPQKMINELENIKPAFGRGETIMIDGFPLEIALVKNPSGFKLSLASHEDNSVVMMAINDTYADGRDMSWLWDVDFSSLKQVNIASGTRAYDMALRLKYDNIPVEKISQDLTEAIDIFLEKNPKKPKKIFCTYTAMLEIRKILSKKYDLDGSL